ncbi:MAG TPA: AAA family ATPase [Armatimonadaceae bacterium]|jgi:general secretion pathway protein A|nr:AAA family ATPase [Armatimonadaceae bacterium]
MYESYFGLKEMPFTVMPDPRYAFRSLGHKLAEGRMRFAADYKSGLAVLTGPVGCGKTTIANLLVADWSDDPGKAVAYLPVADDRGRAAFLKRIMDGFGVESTARNYGDNRRLFERYLLDLHKSGRHAILVLDEGQKIHPDNIDTLVDLTNFQTATEKFITVILFAQDNFANKLRTKEAFTSRIAHTGHLDPLSFDDMLGMIAHRLRIGGAKVGEKKVSGSKAGDDPVPDLSPFLTAEALVEVYNITKGVPRDVCIFLSALFLDAYVSDQKPVTPEMVRATLDDMKRLKKWPVPQTKEAK